MKRLNFSFAKRNGFARHGESKTAIVRLNARNAVRRFLSALLIFAMTLGYVMPVLAAVTSQEYFDNTKYVGTYSLSEGYGLVYGEYIKDIKDWSVTVESGQVFLHVGEEKSEVTPKSSISSSTATSVSMEVSIPGWDCYTNAKLSDPAKITITWKLDSSSGMGAFETTAKTVYVLQEDGTSKSVRIPALHFEYSEKMKLAKENLAPYKEEYIVNDGTDEKIVIQEDGTPMLHIGEEVYPPLYYNFTKGEVASVVYTAKDWFASTRKTVATADSKTITMTWDALSWQFTASDATLYKEGTSDISRIYSTTKYTAQKTIGEAEAYMSQYGVGEYTFNDGSGWKIKVDDEGKIYTKFGTDDYEYVAAPVPTFVQNKSYTDHDNGKEYGNSGKYVSSVTIPVTGWYTDEACTMPAYVTLDWHGNVLNPIDYHQFTVNTAAAIYQNTGELACKWLTGTAYSDADRAKGYAVLKNYAGEYHPTAAKDMWYIEIDKDGKATIYTHDFQNNDWNAHTDVAMDLTINRKKPGITTDGYYYGDITSVSNIKIVVPEWLTEYTNSSLANTVKCQEVTFTLHTDYKNAANSSYFYISADMNACPNVKSDGSSWTVVEKSSAADYYKENYTKLYKNDRAYSDASKQAAKDYFKEYAGTYYVDDYANHEYFLTITDGGEIYWGASGADKGALPADVVLDTESDSYAFYTSVYVWYNGYTDKTRSTSTNKTTQFNNHAFTQRGELSWISELKTDSSGKPKTDPNSLHSFASEKTIKGYLDGAGTQLTFPSLNHYVRKDAAVDNTPLAEDGTYETVNGDYKIVIQTEDDVTSYTFYDADGEEHPLTLLGEGNSAYLRGNVGMLKKKGAFLVVTKGPYEGFLISTYEATYTDASGKDVTIPAGTVFTDNTVNNESGKIIVVNPGETKENGKHYDRLNRALRAVEKDGTLYLEDDIEIGVTAELRDKVGKITIDGQNHTITRDTDLVPNAMHPSLDDKGNYTGSILWIGAGNTVTLKNVTIDGLGKWKWDDAKLEYDKKLNQDYDINILDDPLAGHPITVLEGNVVSTDSLIKVAAGELILDKVNLQNFFAGDGYDDDRHFIDFTSTEKGKLEVKSETVFKHNASRSGVCIGNTDDDEIKLNGFTTMQDNYCYGGNGGLVVAMEATQVYMDEGTKIINNVAADTNGVFIQLHKRNDGVKDGDNKGEIFSKLHMNGGLIQNNIGLRGGSYGWGQTIYLYNGGAFEMNGGEICYNMGAGISTFYQQPSADMLELNAGNIHDNECSLRDGDLALDISVMNEAYVGKDMIVGQNFVVGAAAILGGYASGDEFLTNDGTINGSISVYSYFNNEGKTTTVVNNNIITGDIIAENGAVVKNGIDGQINGNVKIRGSLTESAGESSFHNEGDVIGNVELTEYSHLYNNGEIYGDVTVRAGATLEMNNNNGDGRGGTVHGNVTLYPDSLIYAEVTGAYVDGTIYLEYETKEDLERMKSVLQTCGIQYSNLIEIEHKHSEEYDETVIKPDSDYLCTDPTITLKACKICGKVVEREESAPAGHSYYVSSTTDATCTTGKIDNVRCYNCSAYNSTSKEMKYHVSEALGHNYVEIEDLYIPPTEYAVGHCYYICTTCGDVLEFELNKVTHGKTKHSFQNDDGSLKESAGKTTKDPTCTEAGEMTFTCTDCGTEIKIEIPAKGHKYTLDPSEFKQIKQVDSNCTSAGYIMYAPACTVCGEIAEDNTYHYQVNLSKLGHDWSEWQDVEDGTEYLCTDERKQIRTCKREGCYSTETRLGGAIGHTWDKDNLTCIVCGYYKYGHHINYVTNGGTMPNGLADFAERIYKPGNMETLWMPANDYTLDGVWTKQTEKGQAVFAGWSLQNLGVAPFEEKPETTFISQVVIPENSDATVFAVWAMDKNKNGMPDYIENKVSIYYDKNGGVGTVPDPLTDLLPGAAYTLETAPKLTKGDDYIFAGWSRDEQKSMIETDADKDIINSLVTSPFTVPSGKDDITLYAVYAKDANKNGKPDYCDNALHVEYYINGGDVNDGYTVDESDMFYICNDNHWPGEDATLLAVDVGAMMIHRENAVLIGWSAYKHEGLMTSEKDVEGLLIKTVSLNGAEANAKVYAVWAADNNNNCVADYTEKLLNHTYHRNQFLSQNNETTLKPGEHLKIDEKEPEFQTDILPGMGVELADNNYFGSADLVDSKGNVIGHYVQVGWSAYSHGACTSHKDYDNWVIAGEENGYTKDGKYYRVIVDERFQNAFAVWAADENGNDIADFQEMHYTVTLDINGGRGGDDFKNATTVKENDTFTFPADPTKEGHTFRGWSADGGDTLYKAGETVPVTSDVTYIALYDAITHTVTLDINGGTPGEDFYEKTPVNDGESFTFPADPTKEGYIFLGWSTEGDENLYKAGDTVTVTADVTYVAQYESNTATLTYDANGGTGEVPADQTCIKGEKVTLESGEGIKRENAVFLGWSLEQYKDIIKSQEEEDAVTLITEIESLDADTTVYAVWAADKNGNGIPDYKQATLTYDANGGEGDVPAEKIYSRGDRVTLESGEGIRRENAVFLGWSLEQYKDIIKSQEEEDTVKIITEIESLDDDTTVYAVWAVDKNGNGIPDYKQATLIYDANGGTGEVPADQTCIKGEKVTLESGKGIKRENAVFLGWSLKQYKDIIKSQTEEDAVTFITEIESLDADTTVYAVWAVDENGNDIPDYKEDIEPTAFKVHYDANGGTGDVPANKTYNKDERVTLESGEGIRRENAVFLGWSLEKYDGVIQSQEEENSVKIITEIESLDADTTVYAVWAVDENGNDISDYKEPTAFKVHYDANGGTGDVPADKTYNKGEKVNLESGEGIKHENAVFLGWSLEKHDGVIKSQEKENSVTIITEIESLDADTTVYAVWAIDEKGGPGKNPDTNKPVEPGTNPSNPNDVPDYKQATLTYDTNGGTGDVPADKTYNKGDRVTLESGEGIKRENAVFLGWSLEKHDGVIQSQEAKNSVTIITEIESLDADTTVYAVWAVAEDGNSTPGYDETPEDLSTPSTPPTTDPDTGKTFDSPTTEPGETIKPPQTGDNSHLELWLALMILSIIGLFATIRSKKVFDSNSGE